MNASDTQLETVNVHLADGVATVELNRPEVLNAWNAQLGADLLAALREPPRTTRCARWSSPAPVAPSPRAPT